MYDSLHWILGGFAPVFKLLRSACIFSGGTKIIPPLL